MKKLLPAMMVALVALSALAGAAQAQEKAGDVAAGQKKVAMCIGCHGIPGYQSSFPEVHKVPKISGQNAKFIASALNAYKKGERKHPTMRGIAETLSEQDIADISAYYAQDGGKTEAPAQVAEPSAAVAELLKRGNCASCHGDNFSKPLDPSYPKIGGQHADYLYVALKSYQTERNTAIGRSNAIMAAQAKPFSHAELKLLANYIASLPGELQTRPQSKFR
jgi:cytochrome c553